MSDLEKAQRRIAALERTIARHVSWHDAAVAAATKVLHGRPSEYAEGAAWWADTLNQPQVILSDA